MAWQGGYIAVDWGTTNRRAYAIGADGRVADSFEDDCGVMAIESGGFEAAAAQIAQKLGDKPMLLAGMVGSNRGWIEAPYVAAPAGIDDLTTAIQWVSSGRIGIVPGVCQKGAAKADVMRGEEVQVLGAVAAGLIAPDCLICHPGTHAKWIQMAGGRVQSFQTMMTGEIFALLRNHSILADQLAGEAQPDAAFAEAARAGLDGADPLASLFGIRARKLLGEGDGDAASWASGLLIGCDVRAGLGFAGATRHVVLMGRPDLCGLYAAALDEAGCETTEIDGATAFLAGIGAIVERI